MSKAMIIYSFCWFLTKIIKKNDFNFDWLISKNMKVVHLSFTTEIVITDRNGNNFLLQFGLLQFRLTTDNPNCNNWLEL